MVAREECTSTEFSWLAFLRDDDPKALHEPRLNFTPRYIAMDTSALVLQRLQRR